MGWNSDDYPITNGGGHPTDEQQKEVFSRNLKRILAKEGKTQKEVADAIGVSPQAINTWIQKISLPRMGKVQALADYLRISKSDLIEDFSGSSISIDQSYNSGNVSNSISDKSSTVNNYYSSAEKCQSKQEITTNSKIYFFTLLDTLKEMTDGEILEMIEYAKYLLSKRKE